MVRRYILNEMAYFGKGAISVIPDEIKKRGFKKALVVSDSNLVKLGITDKVLGLLDESDLRYDIFSDIKPNPTITNVQAGVAARSVSEADYILAIGGGSSLDVAKGIGIIATNPEYYDVLSLELTETPNPSLPIIAVPTAAGTASEVTINYVITDEENKRKFVCVDPNDLPVLAVVDPDMMKSMPDYLVAATGMDALTHAIEGFITKNAWEMSDMFEIKAIEIIARSLCDAVRERSDKAMKDMALGQYIAGMGFSNVGLGIVHGMAHPLGAFYDIPHGVANALLLPVIMEFNAPECGGKYSEIASAMGVQISADMDENGCNKAAVGAVRQLAADIGIPQKLSQLGVKKEDLLELAAAAFIDPNTAGNPRRASEEDLLHLYEKAF